MKLPFIILNRTTYDKFITNAENVQKEIDEMTTDLIQRREEIKNLRYNYEKVKDGFQDLNKRFNKLLHNYNELKKKHYAPNKS